MVFGHHLRLSADVASRESPPPVPYICRARYVVHLSVSVREFESSCSLDVNAVLCRVARIKGAYI